MSDFKAKTHQIRLPPQTPLREPIALPQTSKLDFRGLLLRGGQEKGREKGRGREGKGRDYHGIQPPQRKFSGYIAGKGEFCAVVIFSLGKTLQCGSSC